VPLQVRPFPEHLPYIAALHVTGLRDRFLDLAGGIGKQRPHQEQFDLVSLNPLSLPDLIAHVQRGPALRPDQFLNQAGVTGNLDVIEGHIRILKCWTDVTTLFEADGVSEAQGAPWLIESLRKLSRYCR
jgi:hypothetical protein